MPFSGIGNPQSSGGGAPAFDPSTLTGAVSYTALGVGTLTDPHALNVATVNFTASNIVGNTAGTLGHASGIAVVAAIPGKRILFREAALQFTWVGADYTGGGTVTLFYTGPMAISTGVTAGNSFASPANQNCGWIPVQFNASASGATAAVGVGVFIRSSAAFTQPGSAAGTGTLFFYYNIVDE